MRKVVIAVFCLTVFFAGLVLSSSKFENPFSVNAQTSTPAPVCPGDGKCNGPIYCNGPCDTLWDPPCNCSCSAQLCNYYDNVCYDTAGTRLTQTICVEGKGDWDPHACGIYSPPGGCDGLRLCGGTGIKQLNCPSYISPCLAVCTPPAPTPDPAGPAPTSTPAPTPTPPPLPPPGAPDCRFLSGATSVTASSITIRSYQADEVKQEKYVIGFMQAAT